MIRLWWILNYSIAKAARLKLLLTLAGMSLGIAVYLAIRLASENAVASFSATAQSMLSAGRISVSSRSGALPEKLIADLEQMEDVASVAPYDERFVQAFSQSKALGLYQVIGIDVLADYPGFKPAAATAAGAEPDRKLLVELLENDFNAVAAQIPDGGRNIRISEGAKAQSVRLLAEFADQRAAAAFGGKSIVMDISRFQDLFGSYGTLGRILITPEEGKTAGLLAELKERLPSSLEIDSGGGGAHGEQMTRAFRLNLQFLAGMSLLVGVLLIYNTVSFLVLKHRRDLGILRCIGASKRDLLILSLLSCFSLGLLASLTALPLGIYLSRFSLRAMVETISALYLPLAVHEVAVSPALIAESLLLGPLVSLAGCALPGIEIFRAPPRENLGIQTYEEKFRRRSAYLAATGGLLIALCYPASSPQLMSLDLRLGFLCPLLLTLGFCLMVPWGVERLNLLVRKSLPRKWAVEALLAADHIQTAPRRHAVAVSAMAIALSMLIGLTVMITSFRKTVQGWIEHTTPADLYISSSYGPAGGRQGYLPEDLRELLAANPAVAELNWVSSRKVVLGALPVLVVGTATETPQGRSRLQLKYPQDQTLGSEQCFISEALANRLQLDRGDSIALPSDSGIRAFSVANVFFDYSSDQGVIYLPHAVFSSMYRNEGLKGISVYLQPKAKTGGGAQLIREAIAAAYPQHFITVRSNFELRRMVMDIFDQTFRITYALQLIALFVSAATILNTILMLILDREREFGVLRAIGASRGALIRTIGLESFLLGLYSLVFGVLLGLALAVVLVFVVNRFFFAWSTEFVLPLRPLAATAAAVLLLSLAAGTVPAVRFMRRISGKVLRYE